MAALDKREARKASASVHARRGEECPCGRTVYGNGRISHFRRCPDYLRKKGWAFTATEVQVILRDALDSLPEDLTGEARIEAIAGYIHAAAMSEARQRGLIP